jgi:hypothetical protein
VGDYFICTEWAFLFQSPLSYKVILSVAHHYTNLYLLEFLAEDFRYHMHSFQLPSIENGAHATENFLLKSQVKILCNEVNLAIYCSARSRWIKYQHPLSVFCPVLYSDEAPAFC